MRSGLVVVDKPSGMSSAAVVDKLRRALGIERIGHTGTLDPLATGVLPMCIGSATKIAGYLLAQDKRYTATVELGVATDTMDRNGTELARAPAHQVAAITDDQIEAALGPMRGAIAQVPPMYSAIKVAGRRLYHHAREGTTIERAARDVTVHELSMQTRQGAVLTLEIHCSKGTYVRVIVDELGRALGVGATLLALRRTVAGPFTLAQAVPREGWEPTTLAAALIPMEQVLELPSYEVPVARVEQVRVGAPLLPTELALDAGVLQHVGSEVFALRMPAQGRLLALARVVAGKVRYDRVFKDP